MAPNYVEETAKVEGWDARLHQRRPGGPCEGPGKVEAHRPPVIERLESVAVLVSELEEFVGILERRLEHVCRPGAPTPATKERAEVERATCSLAMAIRETEQKLVSVGWRMRAIIDALEV